MVGHHLSLAYLCVVWLLTLHKRYTTLLAMHDVVITVMYAAYCSAYTHSLVHLDLHDEDQCVHGTVLMANRVSLD
jgi:hypothetical protein